MFKGFCGAICFAVTFLMVPGTAWSVAGAQHFNAKPGIMPHRFPVRLNTPDANKLLEEANNARHKVGVQPLRANMRLTRLAEQRAADMSIRQYYGHKNPDGYFYYDLLNSHNLKPNYSCENLDLVVSYSDNSVISDWLNSSKGHKQCLLNQEAYETGLAIVPYGTAVFSGQHNTLYLIVSIQAAGL